MKRTLIYLDPDAPLGSLELLGVMEAMYGRGASEAIGLCHDTPGKAPADAIHTQLERVIAIDRNRVEPHDTINVTNCIAELNDQYRFDAILISATTFGRMLAPRVAMRLGVGLVADVTAVRHRDGLIEMVRPAFSGRMLAGIVNNGPTPVMLTVRRNVFACPADRKTAPAEMIRFSPQKIEQAKARLTETRKREIVEDIRESEILVSGGAGVMRSFDQLEALADALGGMVAASRKVVDSGKAPRYLQVGQSGRSVAPALYLAIGISGSIQHVVGVRNAETIISVNSDRHAPICALSDIVVEGDARDFIPRMIDRIEQGRQIDYDKPEGETS